MRTAKGRLGRERDGRGTRYLAQDGGPLATPLAGGGSRRERGRAVERCATLRRAGHFHAGADLPDHGAGLRRPRTAGCSDQPVEPERTGPSGGEPGHRQEYLARLRRALFKKGANLKPHRSRYGLTPKPDPEFDAKCADICTVYQAAPAAAEQDVHTVSIDEMTGTLGRGTVTRKSDSTAAATSKENVIFLGGAEPETLRTIGGSKSDRFNTALINSMVNSGWFPPGIADEDRNRLIFVAVTGLQAFKPTDEIEGMIAAQGMAAHFTAMECYRRAMLHEQPFEAAQGLRKAAANASRTFVELLSALDRKRGKGGQQKVTVEHVHVHSGGQAVVGNIATDGGGGGGAPEMPQEPCGTPARLAHDATIGAVLPPLRGADAERETVPVGCDEEPPSLPPARRAQHWPTHTGGPGADPCRPDNARPAHGRDGGVARAGAGTARRR